MGGGEVVDVQQWRHPAPSREGEPREVVAHHVDDHDVLRVFLRAGERLPRGVAFSAGVPPRGAAPFIGRMSARSRRTCREWVVSVRW